MENLKVDNKESNKVIDFICETKEGKYTAEKPDLTYITYSRIEIQEADTIHILNDCYEDVILYGISY